MELSPDYISIITMTVLQAVFSCAADPAPACEALERGMILAYCEGGDTYEYRDLIVHPIP